MTPLGALFVLEKYEKAKEVILNYLTNEDVVGRIKKIAEKLQLKENGIRYIERIDGIGEVDKKNINVWQEDSYCGCCEPDRYEEYIPSDILDNIERGMALYHNKKQIEVNEKIAAKALEIKEKEERDKKYRQQMYQKLKEEFENEAKGN